MISTIIILMMIHLQQLGIDKDNNQEMLAFCIISTTPRRYTSQIFKCADAEVGLDRSMGNIIKTILEICSMRQNCHP